MLTYFINLVRAVTLRIFASAGLVNYHDITSGSTTAGKTVGIPDSSGFMLQSRTTGGAQSMCFDPNVGFLTSMSVAREVLIKSDVPTQLSASIPFDAKILKVEAFITGTDAGQTVGLSINGAPASYTVPADVAGWFPATQAPNTNITAGAVLTQVGTGAAIGWIKVTLGERIP